MGLRTANWHVVNRVVGCLQTEPSAAERAEFTRRALNALRSQMRDDPTLLRDTNQDAIFAPLHDYPEFRAIGRLP